MAIGVEGRTNIGETNIQSGRLFYYILVVTMTTLNPTNQLRGSDPEPTEIEITLRAARVSSLTLLVPNRRFASIWLIRQ